MISARLQYYKNMWAEVDVNMDHKLSLDEINILVNKMNIDRDAGEISRLFNKHDTDRSKHLEFNEFVKMMDELH